MTTFLKTRKNPATLTAACQPCEGRGLSCGERLFQCTGEVGGHDCPDCGGMGVVEYVRRDVVMGSMDLAVEAERLGPVSPASPASPL
jgi:hypothetical protein